MLGALALLGLLTAGGGVGDGRAATGPGGAAGDRVAACPSGAAGLARPAPRFESPSANGRPAGDGDVLLFVSLPSRRPAVPPSLSSAWRPRPSTRPPAAKEPDNWIAEDKLKHLLVSYGATVFADAGLRTAGAGRRPALALAPTIGLALGVWKEWRDAHTGGDVSLKDLVADATGVALGTAVASATR